MAVETHIVRLIVTVTTFTAEIFGKESEIHRSPATRSGLGSTDRSMLFMAVGAVAPCIPLVGSCGPGHAAGGIAMGGIGIGTGIGPPEKTQNRRYN